MTEGISAIKAANPMLTYFSIGSRTGEQPFNADIQQCLAGCLHACCVFPQGK